MTWVCPNCDRRYPDSAIGVPNDADADEKEACQVCDGVEGLRLSPITTDRVQYPNPDTLGDIHERPWSAVEGAHLRVRQEVTDGPRPMDRTRHEEREGELVGRGEGWGLYYDTDRGDNFPTTIGPTVYLETPEDTILELRTDKDGNELLAFTPPEDDGD